MVLKPGIAVCPGVSGDSKQMFMLLWANTVPCHRVGSDPKMLECELTLCLFSPCGRCCRLEVASTRAINLQIRRRSKRAGKGQVTERTFLQGMDRVVANLKGPGS